jgi:hypothetical protein
MTETPTTQAQPVIDRRIRGITPNHAIEIGYNMHLADTRPTNSQIQSAACKIVDEFEHVVDQFSEASPERVYLSTLRMAATGFAAGIGRRKRTQQSRINDADNEQELFLRSFKKGQRFVGFLSGSLKLLLLGGFGFAITHLALSAVGKNIMLPNDDPAAIHSPVNDSNEAEISDGASKKLASIDPKYASLAFALFVTIVGATTKSWWHERRVRNAIKRHRNALKEANEQYQEEVMSEYRLAAETAHNGWLCLTGGRATTTSAFESLLIGVLTDNHDNVELTSNAQAATT